MMAELFCAVLNRSVTAGIVILAVILFRFLFGRISKLFSYLLWFAVLIRLLCPVTLHADFGIVTDLDIVHVPPVSAEEVAWEKVDSYVPEEVKVQTDEEKVNGDISNRNISEALVAGTDENTETTYIYETDKKSNSGNAFALELSRESAGKLAIVWMLVGGVLLLYEVISYCCFMYRLKPLAKEKVVISPKVNVPFVAGIVRPVIYLPAGLDEVKQELVITHEKIHIKRLDYLVKPLFLFACCVHWFHPLVWIAYYLMIQDMESSCDEAVIRSIGYERKKEYAYTLLGLSTNGGWKVGYPIAFGENNVKRRIKNVVEINKKATWLIGLAAFAAGAVTILLLVDRPVTGSAESYLTEENNPTVAEQEEVQVLPAEETAVTEKVDSAETTEHEYYGNKEDTTIPETVDSENADGDMLTDYEQGGDKFAVLLMDSPEAYYELVEILYRYPVEGAEVSNAYGTRVHPVTREERVHSGVDFAAEEGTKVVAAADGCVAETGFQADCGNYIIIQHVNGELTYYACCKEILAEKGTEVKSGQQIATVGKTGASTGAHLHFAVSKDGAFLEPAFAVIQPVEEEAVNEVAEEAKLKLQEELEAQQQAELEAEEKQLQAVMEAQLQELEELKRIAAEGNSDIKQ